MAKQKNIQKSVLAQINEHKYDDLDAYLKNDVDWDIVGPGIIQPKDVRQFVKGIGEKEVRLDVMKFLHKYARQYFREAAENAEYEEKQENMFAVGPDVYIKNADERIALFQQELAFLIMQIEEAGEFSGNRFSKLEKQLAQLKEENEQYKNANQFLQEKIDRFENPHKYGKYIPAELNNQIFGDIMKYLQSAQIALPIYTDGSYGKVITCYQWYGKGLFGYFVIHVSDALNLKKGRDTYDWQIFKPAINNYDELIKEARKAISTCKKKNNKIDKSEIIDEAIQLAIQKAESKKH